MPKRKILSLDEIEDFETPPDFNSIDREKIFDFSVEIKDITAQFKNTHKVYFLVMFGYFRVSNKFFPKKNHQKDIEFVAENLNIPLFEIETNFYDRLLDSRYRKIILKYFGFKEFKDANDIVIKEINSMIRSQLRPKLIMLHVLEILHKKKIEIPKYTTLANIIIDRINNHSKELSKAIESHIDNDCRELLDSLLEKEQNDNNKNSKVQRYKLTLLKKINQSSKPTQIKLKVQDLQTLKELFKKFEDVIQFFDLTNEGIKYYANSVIKGEIFQVSRQSDENKYLHLIAFTINQYFKLQDTVIEIFLIYTQRTLTNVHKENKEKYYEGRKEWSNSIDEFVNCFDKNIKVILTGVFQNV